MKGRGAQSQLANPYERTARVKLPVITDFAQEDQVKTIYQKVVAKSIVTKVDSPDLNFNYSLNPYQGCEHGCTYCYARPTHAYWGYNAGLDFETKIMVKENAPDLLRKKLRSKSWKGETIMFSGNTDCYQPIEKKMKITRELLEICLEHKQSVGIITKNDLILRDLDILEALNEQRLVQVAISITTLNERLRREMEPRTSSAYNRLSIIQKLAAKSIPVSVMMAPVIPGLNDHEMLQLAGNAAKLGADAFYYTLIRLNDEVETVFSDWLEHAFPKRKEKVLNLIRSCRGGELGEKKFFDRMKGSGSYAQMIHSQYQLAMKKYYLGKRKLAALDKTRFEKHRHRQLSLF
jgi:DNA repair photolyase